MPAADLTAGTVTIWDIPGQVNVFAELIERLGHSRPAHATILVPELAPQIVVGHRLWREASNRSERFVALEKIELVDNSTAGQLWLRLWLRRRDLGRYNLTHTAVLRDGGLQGSSPKSTRGRSVPTPTCSASSN